MLLAVALAGDAGIERPHELRPVAWVPAVLGLIGVALLVQIGGNKSYEFIYFRF